MSLKWDMKKEIPLITRDDINEVMAIIELERNVIQHETAIADEVRWQMTAPNEREVSVEHTRFGGGRRPSTHRCWEIADAVIKERVDAAYLSFGKYGPTCAWVAFTSSGRIERYDCQFWMSRCGRLYFITRERKHSFYRDARLIALEAGRLVMIGPPPAEELASGRKRAKAALRNLQVTRPGKLIDQHFFDDCSWFSTFRLETLPTSNPVSVA